MPTNQHKVSDDLICRKEIEKLSGVSRSKVSRVICTKEFRFPEAEVALNHNRLMYNKSKVLDWFKDNDMKTIRIINSGGRIIPSKLDNNLVKGFLSDKKLTLK